MGWRKVWRANPACSRPRYRAQIESHTRLKQTLWRRLIHAPTRRLTLIVSPLLNIRE